MCVYIYIYIYTYIVELALNNRTVALKRVNLVLKRRAPNE